MCSNCSVASSKTRGYARKVLVPMEGFRGQLAQNHGVPPQTGFGYFSRENKASNQWMRWGVPLILKHAQLITLLAV